MVKESQAIMFAYLFQMAHRYTWTYIHRQMGVTEVPISRAYCSTVSIDTVSRKSPTLNLITPSNSYQPPDGDDLTIHQIIQRLEIIPN